MSRFSLKVLSISAIALFVSFSSSHGLLDSDEETPDGASGVTHVVSVQPVVEESGPKVSVHAQAQQLLPEDATQDEIVAVAEALGKIENLGESQHIVDHRGSVFPKDEKLNIEFIHTLRRADIRRYIVDKAPLLFPETMNSRGRYAMVDAIRLIKLHGERDLDWQKCVLDAGLSVFTEAMDALKRVYILNAFANIQDRGVCGTVAEKTKGLSLDVLEGDVYGAVIQHLGGPAREEMDSFVGMLGSLNGSDMTSERIKSILGEQGVSLDVRLDKESQKYVSMVSRGDDDIMRLLEQFGLGSDKELTEAQKKIKAALMKGFLEGKASKK